LNYDTISSTGGIKAGGIKAGGIKKLGVIVMLNKFGKKICAGVCALSMGFGFNSNVKSDALFWDVALIANEFLSGAIFTLSVSRKSAENLVKLIKYLATFEEEYEDEEEDEKLKDFKLKKDYDEEEQKMVPVTWNQKLKKIKEGTPGILFGVLGPILLADAAKRSYELYKNLSESSSNQKKTSGNENIAGNKENKK